MNETEKYKYLGKINSPDDLKKLSESDMPRLAEEIREELISRVTENGGHLASNLGVVELTMAIHRVFNAPKDHIIFDVGHQSYVHKMLTGRFDKFDNSRRNFRIYQQRRKQIRRVRCGTQFHIVFRRTRICHIR